MTEQPPEPVVLDYRGPDVTPGWPAVYSPWQTEFLLIRAGADLPERCVKCNLPAHGRPVRVRLRWVDPRERDGYRGTAYGLVALLVWIGFVIEGLFKQRVARTGVSLCRRHRALRWVKFLAWLTSPGVMFLVYRLGLAQKSPGLVMIAVIAFVAWLWRCRTARGCCAWWEWRTGTTL